MDENKIKDNPKTEKLAKYVKLLRKLFNLSLLILEDVRLGTRAI